LGCRATVVGTDAQVKVVIAATNPLEYLDDGSVRVAFGFDDSLGERVQRKLPEANVVKAFNTVGNPYMIDPSLPGGAPTMPTCGNDADAKATVSALSAGVRLGAGGPCRQNSGPRRPCP
jgi:predicted dinucleotide-binding enzyme